MNIDDLRRAIQRAKNERRKHRLRLAKEKTQSSVGQDLQAHLDQAEADAEDIKRKSNRGPGR